MDPRELLISMLKKAKAVLDRYRQRYGDRGLFTECAVVGRSMRNGDAVAELVEEKYGTKELDSLTTEYLWS